MAIIPKFHVVAAERPVAAGVTLREGMFVSLDSTGSVVTQSAANKVAYGICGDTKSTSASSMPGVSVGWQNRVSDYFDETKASGKCTVYHSGGEFATDQFNTSTITSSTAPMTALYSADGVLQATDTQSTSQIVAYLLSAAGSYPSGIPGVDLNGDQALAGGVVGAAGVTANNTYIEIKLAI